MTLDTNAEQAELERKTWNTPGCDWAYFIVQFLRGHRRLEIQASEITETQLYLRSDEIERHALRLVCESEYPRTPSAEDARRLIERDQFLTAYLEGRILGHANWVTEIRLIPARVAERQQFDRKTFQTVYASPRLFGLLWERGSYATS